MVGIYYTIQSLARCLLWLYERDAINIYFMLHHHRTLNALSSVRVGKRDNAVATCECTCLSKSKGQSVENITFLLLVFRN